MMPQYLVTMARSVSAEEQQVSSFGKLWVLSNDSKPTAKAFDRFLTNILKQNKRKCIPLYTLVDTFTWLGFYFHQFFLIMNIFVPMFKHSFAKLVWFSKSVFKSGSLGFALSHKLCYILHPVGFISVIFTTARRSDKQNQSACST